MLAVRPPLVLAIVLALGSLVLSAALLLPLVQPERAGAHGALDQALLGDPECNSTNFKSFVSSSGELRQEFVPGQTTLLGVDLCLGLSDPETQVDVNIRAGTAQAPDDILASASVTVPAASPGLQFVHVDLPSPLATEPGEMLVLELPQSYTFAWYGTCPAAVDWCTADADLYPPGGPSTPQYMLDFAFRTYGGGGPQRLWGDIDCSGGVAIGDAQKIARDLIGLPVSQAEGCPRIESVVTFAGQTRLWGDTDCGGAVGIGDAQKIARDLIDLPISQAEGCPRVGEAG